MPLHYCSSSSSKDLCSMCHMEGFPIQRQCYHRQHWGPKVKSPANVLCICWLKYWILHHHSMAKGNTFLENLAGLRGSDMSDTFSLFSCDLMAGCTSATYTTRYWSQHMGYLSPDDTERSISTDEFGWKRANGYWSPAWLTIPKVSDACRELINVYAEETVHTAPVV